jgi:DNA polymerase I-like protein with 3'-5' exonuclease and polymerase domains
VTLTVNLGGLPAWVCEPDPTIYEWGVPLFLDFETTGLDKGSALTAENRIVLACWQLGWDGKVEHKWGGQYEQEELCHAITKCTFIVAHNVKFELQWLARCGIDLSELIVYDTQLAEYVIGGNRWKTENLSLELTARRHGLPGKVGLVSRMIKAGICPSEIPQAWLLKYCEQDVALLPSVMTKQLDAMSGTRLLPVVYNRCLLAPVLADIETNGMQLDQSQIQPLWEETETKYAEAERALNEMAKGVNWNSPKQVAAFLYDELKFPEPRVKRRGIWVPLRSKAGGRKTDADTIAALVPTTDEQKQFKERFEYAKELFTLLKMYLRKFNDCCVEAGGILYGVFNQTQTYTHRLSSSGRKYKVQFQNFPRQFKKFFRAPEGWLVGETDGAQLEFRVAGHLGRDVAVIADVVGGVDVHSFTAETLTVNGQETNRQDAKTHTFKPLYGGSSGTEAEQAYYRAFKEKYPGVAKAQQVWINNVLLDKKLETEWGLVYYWPDTKMDRSGYITNTTSICNYPVQAFATAEIIPISLVCMWHRLKRSKYKMYLVNTIHDSIVAYLPPEEREVFVALARQCMIEDTYQIVERLYGIKLIVPLGCGIKIADHWAATKDELKFEAPKELYERRTN